IRPPAHRQLRCLQLSRDWDVSAWRLRAHARRPARSRGPASEGHPGADPTGGRGVISLLTLLVLGPPDTLRLARGVHLGPLVISRPTVVLGETGAVIRGSGRGSVVEITAAGTLLRGLRIEHSGRDTDRDDAGVMIRADSVTLEDLEIRDVLFGVYLRKAADVTILRVDIEGPRG